MEMLKLAALFVIVIAVIVVAASAVSNPLGSTGSQSPVPILSGGTSAIAVDNSMEEMPPAPPSE
jgi:hypothetical protein